MSTTLSFGPVSVTWPWTYQLVAAPSNTSNSGPWQYQTTGLSSGTGAGQADTLYAAQLSLANSGNTTINLASVENAFNTPVNFVRLKAFYIENSALAKASSLVVGGAATNAFTGTFFNAATDTLTLRAGMHLSVGVCQDGTGYVVGSGNQFLLTNGDSGNTATVNVGFAGCSA